MNDWASWTIKPSHHVLKDDEHVFLNWEEHMEDKKEQGEAFVWQ